MEFGRTTATMNSPVSAAEPLGAARDLIRLDRSSIPGPPALRRVILPERASAVKPSGPTVAEPRRGH
jgi:hypothetical protein